MEVIKSVDQMANKVSNVERPVGFVPTMGAIHEGHMDLVRKSRCDNKTVVVSIFVNRAQFGSDEDFMWYPRDLEKDLRLLEQVDADIVFIPSEESMYPQGFEAQINVGSITDKLEGKYRKGHFNGVATVVLKLFNIVQPDRVYFGQKDGQQLAVISKMIKDLDLCIGLVKAPTVRDKKGLAISSRNVNLTMEQLNAARVIYQALSEAKTLYQSGITKGSLLKSAVKSILHSELLISSVDYVSVADPVTLEELDEVCNIAMVSTAVHIGGIRLIDNVILG